ncbi:MAG: cupredoxin family protein [Rhodocyclaceae bacterium]|nr:cupredoxin family protein [Rhodocyclaceae bacterium]
MRRLHTIAAILLSAASAGAFAHGGAGHGDGTAGVVIKEQKPWGIAGEAADAVRTVEVGMSDAMRFTPARIRVRQGETLRFRLKNDGAVMHEMVIGTADTLAEHAALMKRFPNMEHDEPYMAHVAPGTQGEIVWTFNRAGDFDFACLIPGHYDAGMIGKIEVAAE